MDYLNNLAKEISNDLSSQFDSVCIEALNNKGYFFYSDVDVRKFIKECCRW